MQYRLCSGRLVSLNYPTLGQVRQVLLEDELTSDVINNFVEKSVGVPIDEFLVIDRDAAYWILIALLCRGTLSMTAVCSQCGAPVEFVLNFRDVEIPKVEQLEAFLELPVSKKTVTLRQPRVRDLASLDKITDEDLVSIYTGGSLESIEELPYIDYLTILAKIMSMRVEIAHEFKVCCSEGHENSVRVGTYNLRTPYTLKTIIADFWQVVKKGIGFVDFLEMTDKEILLLKDLYGNGS